jgi:hypothetical protein
MGRHSSGKPQLKYSTTQSPTALLIRNAQRAACAGELLEQRIDLSRFADRKGQRDATLLCRRPPTGMHSRDLDVRTLRFGNVQPPQPYRERIG